ncbi:unnamed protein product [Ilex paraguariensis]|uniref:NAC domain-containing protein n=1 Tax=Ilex paraguariensis TaxID=185542 RepID=A0ABC8QVF1_9AQUA
MTQQKPKRSFMPTLLHCSPFIKTLTPFHHRVLCYTKFPQIAISLSSLMGDNKNPTNPTSYSLPPGSRFYPSDEQLLCCYLTSKNNGDPWYGLDVIKEIDLYNYNPFDLPDPACFRFGRGGRKRHWYCFVSRVLKERGRRRAGGGYWRKMGRVRDVVGGGAGKVVVGTRKFFVFYLGDEAETAVRTDWVMYEYALIDPRLASFVLCRVFVKPRRGNNVSEQGLSSCGEESVTAVRHIGVQYDGTIKSLIGEDEVHDDNSVDRDDEVLRFPVGLMRSSGHISSGTMIEDDSAAQQFTAIQGGDFIELDDLFGPLPGLEYA